MFRGRGNEMKLAENVQREKIFANCREDKFLENRKEIEFSKIVGLFWEKRNIFYDLFPAVS